MSEHPPESKRALSPSVTQLISKLEDPQSLETFLPDSIKEALKKIPPELLDVEEEKVEALLERDFGYKVSNTLEALRNNFWLEYDRVQSSRFETTLNMYSVHGGVCSRAYFSKMLLENPERLSYILCRPPDYQAVMAGMSSLSTRRLRQMLSIPLEKKPGELQDPKILELILKAIAMNDLRVHGGYLNRSETKNLNLIKQETNHTYTQALTRDDSKKTAQELESDIKLELQKLEEEARTQLPPPEPRFEEQVIDDAEYKDVPSNDD